MPEEVDIDAAVAAVTSRMAIAGVSICPMPGIAVTIDGMAVVAATAIAVSTGAMAAVVVAATGAMAGITVVAVAPR